ncbi:SusC/RagA family TonB-linked outer membrane protein [Chryseobacterium sp. SNU WT5]|uniref:SusC/RagA family TonB-linked outer membrane protein n=1 Tax=Chryseobacterium sp. SNU WT5 TaxID=2594269 RepID=UPI00117C0367|nr:SusC/RagA family TonB-linked outer membrane protein [Chryseobacterium sp. SNU WT5]QDP84939.1 SusC/RagA family TonB-linked outer membrane protein [Chryseobacterium sp. SNU WT5]
MKKLTTSVLAVVLTASFAMVDAQKKDTARVQDIEGVVVTALGIKRDEKSLPFATQVIKSEELNVTQNVDVKNAIVGKVSGVQLNGQAGSKLGETGKLRIRGAVSMLSDADPIYVLDGVIVDPNTVDMDNLESVNVLKGPNATALYGQRAQYGVVVMTLKKGAKNRLNIELNSTTNIDFVARTMKFQNEYGQGYDGQNSFGTFNFNPARHPAEWASLQGLRYKKGQNYLADESWGAKFDGQDYLPWYAFWKDSPYFGQTAKWNAQPNNVKDFYDSALTSKNSVSVSGGTNDFTGRVSFTNLMQNGITPYTELKRNYFNTNANYKFNDKLNIEAVMNFSQGRTTGDFDDGYSNQTSGSFNQWFGRDLDVNKLKELKDLETPFGHHASWNWWGPDYLNINASPSLQYRKKPGFWYNPFTYMERFQNFNDRKTLMFSVAPTYKITDDLTARASFSRVNNISQNSYYMPTSLTKSASGMEGGYMDYLNGFGVSDSDYTEDQYEGRLSYAKKFGSFDVNSFVGGNVTKQRWSGVSNTMDVFGKTQFLLTPDVYSFKNANIAPVPDAYNYGKTYKSLFGNVSVGYNDYVYVDASVRNDINSAYLNNQNSFLTYSLGTSILLHNLIEKNDYITYFKLRAGIAQIASDISARQTNPQYFFYDKPLLVGTQSYQMALQPTRYVDPNLKPAINENFEVGADIKFLKNRVTLSGTYYKEKRNDEPIPVTLPSSSGALSYFLNSGDAQRKGVELSLSGDVLRNSDGLNWTTSLNFAQNKSTIVRVAEGLDNINYGFQPAFGYVSVIQKEGMEWGQLVGNGFLYDGAGNKVIDATTGLYEFQTNVNFGSILPKFTGGWYNAVSYKGVTLAASIDFQKGGKFFSLSEQWGNSGGLLEATAAMNDRGFSVRDDVAAGGGVHVVGVDATGAAVDTYVGAQDYFTQFHGNRLAEPYIHDASYIKLREVGLSYTLPKAIFTGTSIQGLSVGLTARNPWLIAVSKDNTHRQDPSEMSQSYGEDGQLPSTKGYGVNVKINF